MKNNVRPKVSIVVPVYDEAENIGKLIARTKEILQGRKITFEFLAVDDGSQDNSADILREEAKLDSRIKVIRFKKNFGQTAAIAAGFRFAKGEIIIPMDADLQNDPADIPRLLEKLNEGYDVVSGWRKHRQDPFWTRKLPSAVANWLISVVTRVKLHDYGCTLKAYRREVIENVKLYGEMHRFIPAYAAMEGAKIAEIEVSHHARETGRSKYGLFRTFRVLLDLLTVKMMTSYATKPIYMFGGLGIGLSLVGVIIGIVVLIQKYAYGIWVHRNPLLLLAVFIFLLGTVLLMMGLLGEIVIRVYFESSGKEPFRIESTLNIEQ